MVQRSLSLVVVAGLLSCKGDPTGELRNGVDHLISDPSSLFVGEAATKLVTISAVDEQGNAVAAKFSEATAVGAGITVEKDLTFRPIFDDKGNLLPPKEVVATRYKVTSTTNTANSAFTVNAGGKSITIPVRTIPSATQVATLSNAAPAVGDTITITLPDPYKFNGAATATAGVALFKVGTTADSTQMRVVVPGGLSSTVTLTGIVLGYAPAAAVLTATSTAPLVTPSNALTLSKTNAAIGDTIVISAPAGYRFIDGVDTTTVGTAPFAKVAVSTDSTQLRILIGPNSNSTVRVGGLRVKGVPTYGPFALTSTATLVSPVVTSIAATFSTLTPAIHDTITLTAPAGMKFRPTATVTIGGVAAFITSRAADSLSVRLVPFPGTANSVGTVAGIIFSTLPQVSLTLPTAATVTVPAALTGAVAIATAPTINIPIAGATTMYVDNGPTATAAACDNVGAHCRFYKIVLAAPRTFRVTLNWGGTADFGGYFIDAAGNDQFEDFACDNFGSGAAGQPEQCSQTLPAGTWYLALADFTAAAQNTTYRITLLGQ